MDKLISWAAALAVALGAGLLGGSAGIGLGWLVSLLLISRHSS